MSNRYAIAIDDKGKEIRFEKKSDASLYCYNNKQYIIRYTGGFQPYNYSVPPVVTLDNNTLTFTPEFEVYYEILLTNTDDTLMYIYITIQKIDLQINLIPNTYDLSTKIEQIGKGDVHYSVLITKVYDNYGGVDGDVEQLTLSGFKSSGGGRIEQQKRKTRKTRKTRKIKKKKNTRKQ